MGNRKDKIEPIITKTLGNVTVVEIPARESHKREPTRSRVFTTSKEIKDLVEQEPVYITPKEVEKEPIAKKALVITPEIKKEEETFLNNFLLTWKEYPFHSDTRLCEDELLYLRMKDFEVNGEILEDIHQVLRYCCNLGYGALRVRIGGKIRYISYDYYALVKRSGFRGEILFQGLLPMSVLFGLSCLQKAHEPEFGIKKRNGAGFSNTKFMKEFGP